MLKLNDPGDVKILIEGDQGMRGHFHTGDIREKARDHVALAIQHLQSAYDLLFLEGLVHCDHFHQAKKDFRTMSKSYGYISSYVRRECGSNTFRFQYRRPSDTGGLIRENISMRAKGYTHKSFKRAAHEHELDLALVTEEAYSQLRKQGKTIREVIRKLNLHSKSKP